MDLSKIKQLHIWILGTVLIIIAEAVILFMMFKPQSQKFDAAQARYVAASDLGNDAAKAKADADLLAAKKNVQVKLAEMDGVMKRRMPVLDFSRREYGMIAMWWEQITKMGPMLESFANDRNVRVTPVSFSLPAPPSSPSDALFDSEVLNFPLGTMTAQGDFKSLMDHIVRWNNCKRLILVDGVSLTGNSPNLTVSYSIQCYVFPTALGGPKSDMWGASTGGGGGTGMSGPGGGMPGMGMMGMGSGAKAGGMAGAPGGPPAMGGGMPGMGPGAKAGGMGGAPGGPPAMGGAMPGAKAGGMAGGLPVPPAGGAMPMGPGGKAPGR